MMVRVAFSDSGISFIVHRGRPDNAATLDPIGLRLVSAPASLIASSSVPHPDPSVLPGDSLRISKLDSRLREPPGGLDGGGGGPSPSSSSDPTSSSSSLGPDGGGGGDGGGGDGGDGDDGSVRRKILAWSAPCLLVGEISERSLRTLCL